MQHYAAQDLSEIANVAREGCQTPESNPFIMQHGHRMNYAKVLGYIYRYRYWQYNIMKNSFFIKCK